MLFISLSSEKQLAATNQLNAAKELRLDLFERIDLKELKQFIQKETHPVLCTIRGELAKDLSRVEEILRLGPAFCDLEYGTSISTLQETFPRTKFILSYHDMQGVPSSMVELYAEMSKVPAHGYKIAVTPSSSSEAMKLLLFAKKHPRLSVLCMGKDYAFARVLGPIMGNQIDFACVSEEEKTAPGQISWQEWQAIYHYTRLNTKTRLYGLIGDPVEQSIGHLHHNRVFEEQGIDAVYVKMRVSEEELAEFIPLAKQIGFVGISVTMPLKEKILPYLDKQHTDVGAINTLSICDDQILGINTDGKGALDALEEQMSVKDKQILLLGAGGAARAIAHEARKRGAKLLIANRSVEKAESLAKETEGKPFSLDKLPSQYDIIINCCPDPAPIDQTQINKGCVAMDISYGSQPTQFYLHATHQECTIVCGKEMFSKQAAEQTSFWLRDTE